MERIEHTSLVRLDPNLDEVDRLVSVRVVLRVTDSSARRGELHLSALEHLLVVHAVLVQQRTVHNVREDFVVVVAVRREALAAADAVLIDHAQAVEGFELRVIVASKRERVIRIQPASSKQKRGQTQPKSAFEFSPAVVSVAAILRLANLDRQIAAVVDNRVLSLS